ncbi:hypothetical protein SAMN02745673_00134 [Marinactinospora thermotolerans DSM 45154]|uniref:Uncharacterized protein n=1 Tax=Marinactinospora thermotolerans DSM 45154 TaxID=1122192 RepID=A0A1T4K2W7_9ACTN|nr:hypothetical protein SAMN02745673_00134 [Marinactinospora thermotolerans DSM 45154]
MGSGLGLPPTNVGLHHATAGYAEPPERVPIASGSGGAHPISTRHWSPHRIPEAEAGKSREATRRWIPRRGLPTCDGPRPGRMCFPGPAATGRVRPLRRREPGSTKGAEPAVLVGLRNTVLGGGDRPGMAHALPPGPQGHLRTGGRIGAPGGGCRRTVRACRRRSPGCRPRPDRRCADGVDRQLRQRPRRHPREPHRGRPLARPRRRVGPGRGVRSAGRRHPPGPAPAGAGTSRLSPREGNAPADRDGGTPPARRWTARRPPAAPRR